MIMLGLTGSIGMGKSTVAAMFADDGVPVFDADAAVHRLQGPEGALVAAIEAAFPGTTGPERRRPHRARRAGARRARALARLEAIVHPAVAREREAFLADHADAPLVVLDIPLLFETGGADQVDAVAVVSAPPDIQRARVLARPGMTRREVRRRSSPARCPTRRSARAPISSSPTDCPLDETRASVRRIIACLTGRARFIGTAMREIVFDTETTGLEPADRRPDGRDRLRRDGQPVSRPGAPSTPISIPTAPMPSEAEAVHGLSDAFLSDKPRFHERCEELLEFLGDAPLVAHNATFDFGFLNDELGQCGRPERLRSTRMVDTLAIARRRHPGAKHQPRRALHPLRRRPQPPRQARRAARRAIARPSLCRADRRAADRPRPRRSSRGGAASRGRAVTRSAADVASARRARMRRARRSWPRHAAFIAASSDPALGGRDAAPG